MKRKGRPPFQHPFGIYFFIVNKGKSYNSDSNNIFHYLLLDLRKVGVKINKNAKNINYGRSKKINKGQIDKRI